MKIKHICFVTPCYNGEESVKALHSVVMNQFSLFPQEKYSHLIIYNASKTNTPYILEQLTERDSPGKVILNDCASIFFD